MGRTECRRREKLAVVKRALAEKYERLSKTPCSKTKRAKALRKAAKYRRQMEDLLRAIPPVYVVTPRPTAVAGYDAHGNVALADVLPSVISVGALNLNGNLWHSTGLGRRKIGKDEVQNSGASATLRAVSLMVVPRRWTEPGESHREKPRLAQLALHFSDLFGGMLVDFRNSKLRLLALPPAASTMNRETLTCVESQWARWCELLGQERAADPDDVARGLWLANPLYTLEMMLLTVPPSDVQQVTDMLEKDYLCERLPPGDASRLVFELSLGEVEELSDPRGSVLDGVAEAERPTRYQAEAIPEDRRELILGMIDTGLDLNDPEFAEHPNVVVQWVDEHGTVRPFEAGKPTDLDVKFRHGTRVAARAAGSRKGVYPDAPLHVAALIEPEDRGGAWKYRVLAFQGRLLGAMNWLTHSSAGVINFSFGAMEKDHFGEFLLPLGLFGEGMQAHFQRLRELHPQEIIPVAATGNKGHGNVATPAVLPSVVSVGALDGKGNVWLGTGYGRHQVGDEEVHNPNYLADGVVDHERRPIVGTSFAAPIISALILSAQHKGLDPEVYLNSIGEAVQVGHSEHAVTSIKIPRGGNPPRIAAAREADTPS